jgi:hypothetical protein
MLNGPDEYRGRLPPSTLSTGRRQPRGSRTWVWTKVQPRPPHAANVTQRMLGHAGRFMIIFGYLLGT